MHGVKRTKLSKEDQDQKRAEDAEQIKQYRTLVDGCLDKKANKEYTQDAFDLTNRVLDLNPEFYTIWNYRRMIMLEGLFPNATPEERYHLLTSDLRMTTLYLKIHPKVYWIWTHRKWCLEHVPDGPGRRIDGEGGDLKAQQSRVNGHNANTLEISGVEVDREDMQTPKPTTTAMNGDSEEIDVEGWKKEAWGRELMLVEKMLEADSRNSKTPETEIRYTTKKIESNFSNFSAWHQRTKELGKVWDALRRGEKGGEGDAEVEIQEMREKGSGEHVATDMEGSLLTHMANLAGDDVSTLQREISQIKELLEAEPDSKWPLESLVHYSQLLLRAGSLSSQQASQACMDMQRWLRDLERIDPFRKERYRELGEELQKDSI
ncbi:hypothetical protein QFC20_000937 [Naganishia adeliensis]|uniref:Uncharacterized protein n=1 Tax=Naganishia adeliensis TaxID=92952 RepID=A0ACC2WVF2_9TREE|nr:hypothetical protein QFC20_000937 [Naganishia adeliensis]